MPRLPCRTFLVLLFSYACSTGPAPTDAAALPPPPPDQILWQRTLEDALAIAQLRHQPLLLAINMDGESASDRIYSERYRDPQFVAATRYCVCLGASVFRHNARDHDEQGRRIPCPRFGEITCGEHMALEPVLFAKYLADGERVAPRHALILPDGTKPWDLSLSFDLKDIDRALYASVQGMGEQNDEPVAPEHRRRLQFEDSIGELVPVQQWLDGLAQSGDASAIDGLLRLVPRSGNRVSPESFAAAAVACGLAAPIGAELLRRLPDATGEQAGAWLATVERLVAAEPSLRLQFEAHGVLTSRAAPSLATLLARADEVTKQLASAAPAARPTGDEMPEAGVLERELEDLEQQLAKNGDDAALHARFAKASLDLGRQYVDAGRKNAQLLFLDAATHFAKAIARDARRYEWFVESARAAYFLQDFANEAAFGRHALALATARPLGELPVDPARIDARVVEALRWLGDGQARRLGSLAPNASDAATVAREALLALGLVAASEHSRANDWIGFASVCGVLSCWRAEEQVAAAGALRWPALVDLRGSIAQALQNSGRVATAPEVAARIAARAPVAESVWFTGQAFVAVAEDCRRRDDTTGAIAAYVAAAERFAATAIQNPAFTDACRLRAAACWFGRGMALVRTADRAGATTCLREAITAHAGIAGERDGLGCDCLDLVDRILEWRDTGDGPVTPVALCDQLAALAPGDASWPTAIADAAIREALRADGRNPERVEKETVDAGGKPMRAMVGLPTVRGDEWLRAAVEIARRAQAPVAADSQPDAKTTLAQACTLTAERLLERGRADGVQPLLAEAAVVLGLEAPAEGANAAALHAAAAQLRAHLGAARPKLREGR
jgi:hypothetical protein